MDQGEISTSNRVQRAHRIAEVRIETVGELHDACSDFIEVYLLLSAIPFNHEHSAFLVLRLVNAYILYNAEFCVGCFQKRAGRW